jgi:hypothetical protein
MTGLYTAKGAEIQLKIGILKVPGIISLPLRGRAGRGFTDYEIR